MSTRASRLDWAAAALAASLILAGRAQGALAPADEVAVRAVCDAYADAWRKNDGDGVMRTLAADAVLLPHHGHPPVIGSQSIRDFWWPPGSPARVTHFEQRIEQLGGEQNLAYVWGRFSLAFSFEDEGRTQRAENAGTFLMVLRKPPGGNWRITHRMWDDPVPRVESVP